MRAYLCRWPNGHVSFAFAKDFDRAVAEFMVDDVCCVDESGDKDPPVTLSGMPGRASREIGSRTEAEAEADRIRGEIRAGTFASAPLTTVATGEPSMTFAAFAEIWKAQRGGLLVHPEHNVYRIANVSAFVLPGQGGLTLGEKSVAAISTEDIEAFRDLRKAQGRSTTTVNHDLKLLRKVINWGTRKRYLEKSPFKNGTETAISLDREVPRDRRFQDGDDEHRLLAASKPHLREITAMLDTACRPGEIPSLHWRDVNMERRELTIRAEKAKTRTARMVPVSTRLRKVLVKRRVRLDGEVFAPDDFVFGDAAGQRERGRDRIGPRCKAGGSTRLSVGRSSARGRLQT